MNRNILKQALNDPCHCPTITQVEMFSNCQDGIVTNVQSCDLVGIFRILAAQRYLLTTQGL